MSALLIKPKMPPRQTKTNFRKQIFELIDQTVKYNEPINISTKSGNAVLISEEDYNNLVETMLFTQNKFSAQTCLYGL